MTSTSYVRPLSMAVANVNASSPVIVRSSAPLFRSTSPDPANPPTIPPTVNWRRVHVTVTSVTSAFVTVPSPLAIEHARTGSEGAVCTVTSYVPPLATLPGKENVPSACTSTVSLLFWSTRRSPSKPTTVPPIENAFVAHVTVALLAVPEPTVPLALATVHVCDGASGCVRTVISYSDPLASADGNVNEPSEAMGRSSAPLS